MRVLAIDVGSSSVKAGLWTGRGFAGRVRVGYRTVFDGVKVEAPVGRIVQAMRQAAKEALGGATRVDAVSFCAFSSGVVVTDRRGTVRAGAITHQDRRSVAEARKLCDGLGEKWLLKHTGNLPYPGGIGSSTLAWLRRHEPGVFAGRGDCRVGQLSGAIASLLADAWVIDPSQAVFLGLWDIGKNCWSERVCEVVGVAVSSLPRVAWADEPVGGLTRAGAKLLGLGGCEGVPVVGGFVDSSAGVIQTPMRAGQLAHSAGSTDVLAMCLNDAAPAAGILSRPVGTGAVFADRWLAVRTIAAAGSAMDWARRTMFSEMEDGAWHKTLKKAYARQARTSPNGVQCIPAFAGDRMAIEQPGGATFDGITLGAKREEILDALIVALVDESRKSYEMLTKIRAPDKTVYMMGGAAELGDAMHRAWGKNHRFEHLRGDSLHGLVELAERAGARKGTNAALRRR